jgi:iron complex transport system substrate-binding protein
VTRRSPLVPALLLALSLAACGGDPAPAGSGTPAAGASGAVPPGTTAPGLTLVHDTGTATLPAEPRRIVTTSDETTELAVALGLQPVGVASTRVDVTADDPFADYYLSAADLGDPELVGGDELNLEAIAALDPDLVLHGVADDVAEDLAAIAPTAVYDVQLPGAWQDAIAALGEATGRQEQATEVLDGWQADLAAARESLAPLVERYPTVGVLYPEYRGGSDNYLLGPEFALAAVVADLGFEVGDSRAAEDAFPGVRSISTELYSTIEADAILALGTRPWQETSSGQVLAALEVPVLGVPLDEGQPSAGPLTSPELLDRYVTALSDLPA